MTEAQPNNPLHGITLEAMLDELVRRHGWDGLGRRIDIRCFRNEPSIASSLKFLRRTPWAREQVEALYLASVKQGPAQPAARQKKDDPE
jgi:uncharacterized protein (DUF2132 family)